MTFRMERAGEYALAGADVPGGTVTFVLGDIAGSTRLWEEKPEAMPGVLARLDELVDFLLVTNNGVRPTEQGEGDSFVAAFTKASDAVAFAAGVQSCLIEEIWPDGADVKLRMALHTGDARRRDERRYMGETLNRCARLRALAHPGQVLLSGTTAGLVADQLGASWFLRDLGVHRLRDLSRPERISQLCGSALPFDFPPLPSLDRTPHNLPVQLTSFVGRVAELAEVSLLLAERRLLTLVGAGGCGKSRFAAQLAAELSDQFPDGVWFTDLAPVADADLVTAAAAKAARVAEIPGEPLLETLISHLAPHKALVVLDNCEHLVDACAGLAERLLRGCPGLRVLATSREPLGADGETTYRVPSLGIPAHESDHDCESMLLFADRAALARPTLRADGDELAAMMAICRRLDGIPLAIELAAARCGALTPAEIAERLDVHFGLLAGGRRHALPRQRALEASIDWSYQLLTDEERLLFRRIAVFAGGFTVEAAEAVGAAGPLTGWAVVDRLAALIDKSLVVEVSERGEGRYRLLEPVRQYAERKLLDAGEAETTRRRHAEFYLALVERTGNAMFGQDMLASDRCLNREIDNLRAACDWATSQADGDFALRLAAPLWLFWPLHHVSEGYRRIEQALAMPGGTPALRAMVLRAASECCCHLNDYTSMEKHTVEALDLVPDGDPGLRGEALAILAWAKILSGDDHGRDVGAEAVRLLRQSPASRHRFALVDALWGLGVDGLARGDGATARKHFDDALATARDLGNPMAIGRSHSLVGYLDGLEGNLAEASRSMQAARPLLVDCQDDWSLFVDAGQGWLAGLGGDLDGGLATVRAAVEEALKRQQLSFGCVVLGALLFQSMLEARAEPGRIPPSLEQTEALMAKGGSPWGAVWCGALRAEALVAAGDLAGARQTVTAALTLADAGPHTGRGRGPTELALARLERASGDHFAAEHAAHRALATLVAANMRLGTIEALEVIGGLAAEQGNPIEGVRLLAAAERARAEAGYPPTKADTDRLAGDLELIRTALADDVFEATWAEAATMSLEEAQAYATRGRGARRRPVSGWDSLTPTELEVVHLVAEGLHNPAIAARLFVSPETVKTHVSNILAKLGVANRTELAAFVARRS
jgi:predicted ATPase/class 3 adenylate cyclase/DNA-binding CsgD family transcriptional regulator